MLLVVVGSLAAPLFEGSFSSIRLRRGGDQVLAAWSEARTHAIEAGEIYQFRFAPEGSDYRIDRWDGGVETDSLGEGLVSTTLSDGTPDEEELADWESEASLPENITFSSATMVTEDAQGERSLTQVTQDGTGDWSSPIFFYPDGTTSEASILLKNDRELYRRVTLRSLTGVARASELLTREEVDRFESR